MAQKQIKKYIDIKIKTLIQDKNNFSINGFPKYSCLGLFKPLAEFSEAFKNLNGFNKIYTSCISSVKRF